MPKHLRILGLFAFISYSIYLAWLAFNVSGLGWVLLITETFSFSLLGIFLFNHWNQTRFGRSLLEPKGTLDVFLTVVNESISLFEETLKASTKIKYNNKKVYVLDDGKRMEIKLLAKKYHALYLARPKKKNRKAGNLNYGLRNSRGEFILVLDADQVPKENIVEDLMGYFRTDNKVAIIATRQLFHIPKGDFNHDVLFYGHAQNGKNKDNAAISCGSGVFYRRSALVQIGGFCEWNIVEDLTTSFTLHKKGYKSIYVDQAYSKGLAPTKLAAIYKQRGTWAQDTMRLFLKHFPLTQRDLKFRQRLHYFEMSWSYLASGIAVPILFLIPGIGLITNHKIIENEVVYFALRLPSIFSMIYFYYKVCGNSFETSQYWAALYPVYLLAIIKAIFPYSGTYKTTNGVKYTKNNILYIFPHLVLIFTSLFALFYSITNFGVRVILIPNFIWLGLMIFWFSPVIKKGLSSI